MFSTDSKIVEGNTVCETVKSAIHKFVNKCSGSDSLAGLWTIMTAQGNMILEEISEGRGISGIRVTLNGKEVAKTYDVETAPERSLEQLLMQIVKNAK